MSGSGRKPSRQYLAMVDIEGEALEESTEWSDDEEDEGLRYYTASGGPRIRPHARNPGHVARRFREMVPVPRPAGAPEQKCPPSPWSSGTTEEPCFWQECGLIRQRGVPDLVAFLDGGGGSWHHDGGLERSCGGLLKLDFVNASLAAECGAFCAQTLGEDYRWPIAPLCALWSPAGRVYTACGKVVTSQMLEGWPPWIGYPVGLLVLALGFAWTLLGGWRASEEEQREAMADAGGGEAEPPRWQEPDATRCRPGGPFASGRHTAPFVFLPCESDAAGAKLQLLFAIPSCLVDPVLDYASLISFVQKGEPMYALANLLSIVPVNDPLQVRGLRAAKETWERGYESLAWQSHVAREGWYEGVVGFMVSYYSLSTSPTRALGLSTVALRMFSIASSFTQISKSMMATNLLKSDVSLDDFYGMAAAKKNISIDQKWFVPLQVLAYMAIIGVARIAEEFAISAWAFAGLLFSQTLIGLISGGRLERHLVLVDGIVFVSVLVAASVAVVTTGRSALQWRLAEAMEARDAQAICQLACLVMGALAVVATLSLLPAWLRRVKLRDCG